MSFEPLIYHAHSEESNRTGQDYVISNHFADYPQLIEELPSDIDPVIVRTEHVLKRAREDNKSFHQRPNGSKDRTFSEEIENRGGQVEYHETHLSGTLGENSFAIIEGIEVNYKRPDSHMTVCGVDVESEIDGWKIGNEELVDLVEDSAWVGIPHWNVMNPKWRRNRSYSRNQTGTMTLKWRSTIPEATDSETYILTMSSHRKAT